MKNILFPFLLWPMRRPFTLLTKLKNWLLTVQMTRGLSNRWLKPNILLIIPLLTWRFFETKLFFELTIKQESLLSFFLFSFSGTGSWSLLLEGKTEPSKLIQCLELWTLFTLQQSRKFHAKKVYYCKSKCKCNYFQAPFQLHIDRDSTTLCFFTDAPPKE